MHLGLDIIVPLLGDHLHRREWYALIVSLSLFIAITVLHATGIIFNARFVSWAAHHANHSESAIPLFVPPPPAPRPPTAGNRVPMPSPERMERPSWSSNARNMGRPTRFGSSPGH